MKIEGLDITIAVALKSQGISSRPLAMRVAQAVRPAIDVALREAEERGRKAGLEEAAQIGEARKPLYEKAGERLAISEVASSIRGAAKIDEAQR